MSNESAPMGMASIVALVLGASIVGSVIGSGATFAVGMGIMALTAPTAQEPEPPRPRPRKKKRYDTADPGPVPPPPPPRRRTGSAASPDATSIDAPAPPTSGAAPGAIKVTVAGQTFLAIEVRCPDGTRKRAAFSGSTANVVGLSGGQDCELRFKGGLPAKYRPVQSGRAYACNFVGSTAQCVGNVVEPTEAEAPK